MIDQPTVLVLGAGASKDFGFPLGWDLKNLICQLLSGDHPHTRTCFEPCGYGLQARSDLATALRHSRALSIDAFLANRQDLIAIGKLAIAATLIPYEEPNRVHPLGDSPSWLDLLFHRMGASKDKWHENQLSIVTFNYDRLVEYYLQVALMNCFGMSPGDALELRTRTVRILHVHGLLGDFTFAAGGSDRTFTTDTDSEIVKHAAEKIRIVHEGNENDDVFVEARQLILAAERIVFMGFGYDAVNVGRLGTPAIARGRHVIGSAFGLLERERVQAKKVVGSSASLQLGARDEKLPEFLREWTTVGN